MTVLAVLGLLAVSLFGVHTQPAGQDDFVIGPPSVCKEGSTKANQLDEDSCEVSVCVKGQWKSADTLDKDECCYQHNIMCGPCRPEGAWKVIKKDGYCAICICRNGQWDCRERIGLGECCDKYKECECTEKVSFMDTLPNNDGCFECQCRNGFWVCLLPTYPPEVCCERFNMTKFCDYECTDDDDPRVIVAADHCVECICVNGQWKCKKITVEECCRKHKKHCDEECCVGGKDIVLTLNKKKPKQKGGPIEGIEVTSLGRWKDNPYCKDNKCRCASTAIIQAEFDKILPMESCVAEPMCRKRMLKISLVLDTSVIGGHHTHVGDSLTNTGFGGSTAEARGSDSSLYIYGRNTCMTMNVLANVFITDSPEVTLWVANDFIRVKTAGVDEYLCWGDCLYSLNGYSTDETIYIGLNRQLSGDEYGTGICKATVRWVCPCNKNDWMDFAYMEKKIPGNNVYQAAVRK